MISFYFLKVCHVLIVTFWDTSTGCKAFQRSSLFSPDINWKRHLASFLNRNLTDVFIIIPTLRIENRQTHFFSWYSLCLTNGIPLPASAQKKKARRRRKISIDQKMWEVAQNEHCSVMGAQDQRVPRVKGQIHSCMRALNGQVRVFLNVESWTRLIGQRENCVIISDGIAFPGQEKMVEERTMLFIVPASSCFSVHIWKNDDSQPHHNYAPIYQNIFFN